jgi:hypothetical protein
LVKMNAWEQTFSNRINGNSLFSVFFFHRFHLSLAVLILFQLLERRKNIFWNGCLTFSQLATPSRLPFRSL